MINFKLFIRAIHDAIMHASDALMDKNLGLLDKYFDESKTPEKNLVAKTVVLEMHSMGKDGATQTDLIHVPLITLIPLTVNRIEKATLTADFEMEIVDGELLLDFKKSGASGFRWGGLFSKPESKKSGKLEITICPQETPEGLKLVIEAYEAGLKRQIS